MEHHWTVGLMTGTVLDGNIDVALIKTDGETVSEFGLYDLVPYSQEIRELLEQALFEAKDWNFNGPEPKIFLKAERALSIAQSNAVEGLIKQAGLLFSDIVVVGFHGQSVLHRAPAADKKGKTRQLGDGQLMADRLGIKVVYDLRSADVQAGGQGAPLCASYHAALLKQIGAGPNIAVLNLGGVANLSWQDVTGRLIAFDTGPANAPINDWVKSSGAGEMDRNGALAHAGTVDELRLAKLLMHPYFNLPFPKSLDRFSFSKELAVGASLEDGAALLTAFSACAVGKALDLLPLRPETLIVCGGGRLNPELMRAISKRAFVNVVSADEFGWRGDAIESECFAFLAMRSIRKLPISYTETTGVRFPITGGRLALPRSQYG